MIACKIFNRELDFELKVKIKEQTGALLFLDEKTLIDSEQYIALRPHVMEWIENDKELFEPFEALSKFLNVPAKEILRVCLFMIAREDRGGYKLLVKKEAKSKEDFLLKFRKYNKSFMPNNKIRNIVDPGILRCTVCHIQYYNGNGQTDIEIPESIAPYLLEIAGVSPTDYSETGYPDGFDPDAPYESDEYKFPEQKSFFEKFSFLRKK